jgi:predicted  nucleic acid-binding Zn-ribbon protein
MAAQYCPKCAVHRFHWAAWEEYTTWSCHQCGYELEEDEKRETSCPRCGVRTWSLVRDEEGRYYRWCCRCRTFEATSETFETEPTA